MRYVILLAVLLCALAAYADGPTPDCHPCGHSVCCVEP